MKHYDTFVFFLGKMGVDQQHLPTNGVVHELGYHMAKEEVM